MQAPLQTRIVTLRIVVYSALYGTRDPLNPECFGAAEYVDRVIFTDNPDLVVPGSRVVVDPVDGLDANRASRRAKLMPHRYFPDHDWSVYLDNADDRLPPCGNCGKGQNTTYRRC